ncbi:hypothetical protein CMT41_18095 [Colwellia sp. MT41]|uniref:glycosyltransferase n=1 Tax=Colwellia sp. MT41 TaxID=58049 RepID=UPI0007176FC5|nr:glycosyltransferase [Colwellia sp. MT41]ALO36441.1 hypothetical protein CMT41_18095 [Colwellia sp. MT41]
MFKNLLVISTEYPPKLGPGACRNFFLCKDFTDNGWNVDVLTVKENSLSSVDYSFNYFNSNAKVHRTAARDSTKIFSILGKYPKFVEIPDRWLSWLFTAIPKGLRLIKKSRPDIIYVSYPNYTSLLVAICLHKLTKIKLVLELRDPFRYRYDGQNVPYHYLYRWIEKKAIQSASYVITTTEECLMLYKQCFPELHNKKTACFKNGFIIDAHTLARSQLPKTRNKKFTLLHSGSLYVIGRNPLPLLEAIQLLKSDGTITNQSFELIFRGCSPWSTLTQTINQMGLESLITFKESIDYIESIGEIYQCDLAIIIQEEIFNNQIPSKLYDIIKTKKPILALSPSSSALSKELIKFDRQEGVQSPQEIALLITTQMLNEPKMKDQNLTHSDRSIINMNLANFLRDL